MQEAGTLSMNLYDTFIKGVKNVLYWQNMISNAASDG